MKRILLWIVIFIVLPACSSKKVAPVQNEESSNAPEVAQDTRTLPTLNDEDIRVEIAAQGAVVDFHCEIGEDSGSILATRIDTDKPKELFKIDAEFSRLAEKPCDLIESYDLNGDGFMDVMTPYSLGMHNAYYYAWIWDNAAQKFVRLPDFEKLSNPDPKGNNQIRTTEHIHAAMHEAAQWELKGKSLVRVRTIGIRPCKVETDEEKKGCFEQYDIVYENGQPRETVKKVSRSEVEEFNPEF